MRDLQEVAKRFFDVRQEWMELRNMRPDEINAMCRRFLDARFAEMRALGWVLGVDVELMNAPKPLPAGVEPVTQVTVTRVEALGCWLLEVPASRGVGPTPGDLAWRSEYWAAFLTDRQVRQLASALLGAYARFKQGRKVPVMVLPISLPVGDGLTDGDAAGAVEADLVPGA